MASTWCAGDILGSDTPIVHHELSESLSSDAEQLQQTAMLLRNQRDELQQQIQWSDSCHVQSALNLRTTASKICFK